MLEVFRQAFEMIKVSQIHADFQNSNILIVDIFLPGRCYFLRTSDEAFREVVEKALEETVHHNYDDEAIDLTRQFSRAEIEELQKHIEAVNRELSATQAFEGLNEKVQEALEEAEKNQVVQDSIEEIVVETPEVDDIDAPEGEEQRETVSIL